ncbi:alpha/beta fold hydrolase [Subtercola endophyticus]|uniref:alpha/beta fold hydrolase n=1 Tax=Subtercola endophyticus TaxID=2895559 RepID=UPI001E5283BD|nr:alpha/beta fold hydrolase [Subtercola endophyticus]UFS58196.1 lipase family protein [Subtercola endophyticus]
MSGRVGGSRRASRVLRVVVIVVVTLLVCILTGSYSSIERRLVEGAYDNLTEAPFYELPNPVTPGAPGTLVRSERLPGAPDGSQAWRIMYHSTDVLGHDILVSGVVLAPTGAAPAGGRTIVSWGHPTTGAAVQCAPSLNVEPPSLMGLIDPFGIEGLGELLAAGYVVAATDYSGMGVAGPDSYLIGTTEGNNVLDAARAARQLPETGANSQLLLWGHSQGGHAVLFAAQDARTYAPELTLLGAAVAAPATQLGNLLKADIGDVSGVSIGSYAFTAYAAVYGPSTPGATLSSILTPAGVAATPSMYSLCLLSQNAQLHTVAAPLIGNYLSGDPTVVQPWATLLASNTPGATASPVPLLVAQGADDTLVRPADTASFAQSECSLGASVTYLSVPDTGHGLVAFRTLTVLLPWFAHLAAGTPLPRGVPAPLTC